jgi:hypothetical protein
VQPLCCLSSRRLASLGFTAFLPNSKRLHILTQHKEGIFVQNMPSCVLCCCVDGSFRRTTYAAQSIEECCLVEMHIKQRKFWLYLRFEIVLWLLYTVYAEQKQFDGRTEVLLWTTRL